MRTARRGRAGEQGPNGSLRAELGPTMGRSAPRRPTRAVVRLLSLDEGSPSSVAVLRRRTSRRPSPSSLPDRAVVRQGGESNGRRRAQSREPGRDVAVRVDEVHEATVRWAACSRKTESARLAEPHRAPGCGISGGSTTHMTDRPPRRAASPRGRRSPRARANARTAGPPTSCNVICTLCGFRRHGHGNRTRSRRAGGTSADRIQLREREVRGSASRSRVRHDRVARNHRFRWLTAS